MCIIIGSGEKIMLHYITITGMRNKTIIDSQYLEIQIGIEQLFIVIV